MTDTDEWTEAVEKAIGPVLRRYKRLDVWEQAALADAVNAGLLNAQRDVARLRRSAVRALRMQGYTLKEIGDQIGISITRVLQIEQGYNRAERAKRKGAT
jgi:DNA-directed RNA polymerase sigma subunit (sigma70/sigma32)